MNDSNKSIEEMVKEILDEVEKTSAKKETPIEKTSSVQNEFKTSVGNGLFKISEICRQIEANLDKVTYDDMKSFWESL